ncbi:hypothetical protein Tco_0813778 [Tanacetum coccineum]
MMQPFLHNKHTIDDIAVALRQGVNYAMAGATTLDWSFLEAEWPERTVINASLEVQLTWFKQSLPSICGNTSGDGYQTRIQQIPKVPIKLNFVIMLDEMAKELTKSSTKSLLDGLYEAADDVI